VPEPETIRDFRRDQIIREARALVAEGGLKAMTYGRLEARLSFTRGVITHHFKNKDDIIQSVLRSALREIDNATITAVIGTEAPEERVRRTLEMMVDGFLSHPESTRILIAYLSEVPHNAHATAFNAGLFARWRRWTAEILHDGMTRGVFCDHDVEAMAAVIVGQVIGAVFQNLLQPEAIVVNRVVASGADAILAVLRRERD